MKFLLSLLVVALLAIWSIEAGELVIDRSYQIVLPEKTADLKMWQYVKDSAHLLQKAIYNSSGITLPVIKESQLQNSSKRIFIGPVRGVKNCGVQLPQDKLWAHAMVVKDQDIYLFGNDIRHRRYHYRPPCTLGTVKAVTCFMEKFCATNFFWPGQAGMVTRKQQRITVPDNLQYCQVPQIFFGIPHSGGTFYDIANGMYPAPWLGSYGGHSHDRAIPAKKYAKSHPEYFAIIKGQRHIKPHQLAYPKYCYSRPEVRQLIYQELLHHVDQGYDWVQLNAPDGFNYGCECPECKKLYGVSSWGEKFWIMHCKMAEQFKKDRPGKKLHLLAYGPTKNPPQTFTKFPDNVVIELAPYSAEVMKKWRNYQVPNGFSAYLYLWGWYHPEGFTPHLSSQALVNWATNLRRDGMCGLYFCGWGELYGLEGYYYYLFLKSLEHPELTIPEIMKQYCQGLFGAGASDMIKFYQLLDQRLALDVVRNENWSDVKSRDLELPKKLLRLRWTPEIIRQLDTYLTAAETQCPSPILKRLRVEFNYLKYTANVVNLCDQAIKTNDAAASLALLQALVQRNKLLQDNYDPKLRPRYFGGASLTTLRNGGRMRGLLFFPYNIPAEKYLALGVPLAGRTISAGQNYSAPQRLVVAQNPQSGDPDIRIQCRRDNDFIYVKFLVSGLTPEEIAQDDIKVFLGKNFNPLSWKRVFCGTRKKFSNYSNLIKTNAQNHDRGHVYKFVAARRCASLKQASERGVFTIEVAMPLSWHDQVPAPGDKWALNVSYRHLRKHYLWQFNLAQKNWRNWLDQCGTLMIK